MKNILVATDFSKAAHNACLYGAELALAFNARLILFSAYQSVPLAAVESPAVLTADDMRDFAVEQLEKEATVVNAGGIIPVETVCTESSVVKGILETAHKFNVDVIITGMKAGGRDFRKLFGSTVTSLSKKSDVPMLVIQEGGAYSKIRSIALACEADIYQESDIHHLDVLREFTELFDARLYLVRVVKDSWQQGQQAANRPIRLLSRLTDLKPEYKCIEGKDIAPALNEFIKGYHIDVLALQPHEHSFFDSLFVTSTTRSVVFTAHAPLLIFCPGRRKK